MEVMVLGFARRLRQASQAASTMASWLSKTRFESQFWRRYCQMFSTGLSSGAREGRKMSVMFLRHGEPGCGVPAGAVEEQHGVGAAPNHARDLVEMELHGLAVGIGHGERGAGCARRADGAEQIGALVALVGGLARARAAPRPLPHEAVLLADAGFVLT